MDKIQKKKKPLLQISAPSSEPFRLHLQPSISSKTLQMKEVQQDFSVKDIARKWSCATFEEMFVVQLHKGFRAKGFLIRKKEKRIEERGGGRGAIVRKKEENVRTGHSNIEKARFMKI
jgi:hypothetical protein